MRLIDTIWAFPYLLLALSYRCCLPRIVECSHGDFDGQHSIFARLRGHHHFNQLEFVIYRLQVLGILISFSGNCFQCPPCDRCDNFNHRRLDDFRSSRSQFPVWVPSSYGGSVRCSAMKKSPYCTSCFNDSGSWSWSWWFSIFLGMASDLLDPRLRRAIQRKAFTEVEQVESVNQSADSEGSRLQIKNLKSISKASRKNLGSQGWLVLKPGECLGLQVSQVLGIRHILSICLLAPSPPMTISKWKRLNWWIEVFEFKLNKLQISGNRLLCVSRSSNNIQTWCFQSELKSDFSQETTDLTEKQIRRVHEFMNQVSYHTIENFDPSHMNYRRNASEGFYRNCTCQQAGDGRGWVCNCTGCHHPGRDSQTVRSA